MYARQAGSSLCRLISARGESTATLLRSNRRADWRAGGPLHLPNAHASCNRTSLLCRHSDLLLPSYPAFETRSRRLDGSTRRLRTLTYSTSTMRRRRASHSQRGSRLRGEVPHRKVEYFHTATIDGNVHTRRPRFHDRASVLKKEPPIAKSYRLLEGHLSSVFHPADNDTFW